MFASEHLLAEIYLSDSGQVTISNALVLIGNLELYTVQPIKKY
mgnify:CR=1 FL=1